MDIGSENFKSRTLSCKVGYPDHYDAVNNNCPQIPRFMVDRHLLWRWPFATRIGNMGFSDYGNLLVGAQSLPRGFLAYCGCSVDFSGGHIRRNSTFHRRGA